jgi:hypothetical protein
MSSISTNRDELISAIELTYQKVRKELNTIPPELTDEVSMEGQIKNTLMSAKNLLSYLVGWGELILKWDRVYTTENRIPDLPETGFTMNDWGGLAQKFYKDYESDTYESLLKQFEDVVEKILSMLKEKDNSEVYGVDWYVTKSSSKGYTFGRMVQLNTSSPYKNAYRRIRRWKKEKNIS